MSFQQTLSAIDWSRMAAPQADGYDTEMTLRLATNGCSPLRPLPYKRRPVDGNETFCDGAVAVRPAPVRGLMNEKLLPAPTNHPNLARAAGLLARWQAVHAQFQRLVDTVYAYTDPHQAALGDLAFGSSSHAYEEHFGTLLVTLDDPYGLAQALVHEMAHQKLRALGVSLEAADRLITNCPAQLFESPIRKDKKRPMTAVFHAQYSFIYVTALDLHMLEMAEGERERQHLLMLLARNVPRMQAGFEQVANHVETDDDGRVFVQAFMDWSTLVLDRGQAVLDASGYGRT